MKKSLAGKHGRVPAARPPKAGSLLLPTLAAIGSGLAAVPAAALELGELELHSALGQPLRASIAYALGPNERIADYCVSLRAGPAASGLPTLTRARISVAEGVISLSGATPVREPLMTTSIVVNCPHTPQLSRDYLIFVDPPGTVANAISESAGAPAAPTVPLTPAAPVPEAPPAAAATPRRAVNRSPLQGRSRYRVQPGDSLSAIVQRLENRQVGLWDAIFTVFDANPDAFIDSDPNKLKAGSWLDIPDDAIVNAVASNATTDAPVVADPVALIEARIVAENTDVEPEAAADLYPVVEAPIDEAATIDEIAPVSEPQPATVELPQAAEPEFDYSALRPGDIVLDGSSLFVSPGVSAATETIIIPDTRIDEFALTASAIVPVATTAPVVKETSIWTSWLTGGAVALFAGLLLFGRKLRERFGSRPIGAAQPSRRSADADTRSVEASEDVVYDIADIDYYIGDDCPTHENLVLDADLIAGIGLEQKTDVDLNQDFGFAVASLLDYELPERAARADEPPSTDILPPMRAEIESILESEVLPEDDDYDMSIIVDVTKIRNIDDVTSRNLRAVAVESDDESLEVDGYTISQDVNYDIVEDKFEDQLSATQALSDEIEKATAELEQRMDEKEDSQDQEPCSDESTAVQLGSVSELDVTVNLPAENDVISDLEDTGINEALTIDLPIDDKTVEMPSTGEEQTVEMSTEPDKLDKKVG